MLRERTGQRRLHSRQAHHLTADLGKPLGAAFNENITVLIHRHDIARVVPAF